MEDFKLEQLKLAKKVILQDTTSTITTVAGVVCKTNQDKLTAAVIVLEFPSLELKETKTYTLENPLPYNTGYQAFRELPAIMEAFNQLEEDPDITIIYGLGINHPRRIGIASHVGLALNIPTIGITEKNIFGKVENNKIHLNNEIVGFQLTTKEYANPIFASPGYKVSLGTTLNLIPQLIKPPHKLPEPLHKARKVARK